MRKLPQPQSKTLLSVRKLITTSLLSSAFTFVGFAQTNTTTNTPAIETAPLRPTNIEDYLVQLAWNYSPEAESSRYEIDAHSQEIQLAHKDWTRNLNAAINLNDVSLPALSVQPANPSLPRIATYPLWQVGLGVNFGDLIQRKNKVKYAIDKKKMSEAALNFNKNKIKAEVLKRYQELLVAQEILKVRLQSLDVAQTNKTQISSLFSVTKASFEEYNQANKAFFEASESKLKAQSDIRIKQIALEEMIGVKWESVEKMKVNFEKR
jgi:outer membrane protein TolC